jgi:CheY-like chemotaxis protein
MPATRILVIEDDGDFRDALAQALRVDGHDVDTAPDGRVGAALICRETPYDLIFCDLRMPGMDGRGLYEEIQRDRPQALRRLVFMSALSRSPEYAPFLREGSVQLLAKPFTPQQLREIVARMIGPRRSGVDPPPN